MTIDQTPRYLNRTEASAYLAQIGARYAETTLAKLASVGGGPTYRKLGRRPLYLPTDLDAWIAERISAPMASSSRGVPA